MDRRKPIDPKHLMLPAAVAALILVAVVVVGAGKGGASQIAGSHKKDIPMIQTESRQIPAIDKTTPAKVETATFALG